MASETTRGEYEEGALVSGDLWTLTHSRKKGYRVRLFKGTEASFWIELDDSIAANILKEHITENE